MATHVQAILSDVKFGGFAQSSVVVEYIYGSQLVLLTQHIVVDVVRRRYLQTARAESDIYIFVFNDRDLATNERNDYFLALEPLIFGIFRVDTHCRISHYRFRTRRCNDSIAPPFLVDVYDGAFGGFLLIVVAQIIA